MTQIIREILGLKPPVEYRPKDQESAVCSNPNQLVGVEIETENIPTAHGAVWFEKNLRPIWMVKEDGSLRGHAYEFISKPAGIGILIPELAQFFKTTKYTDERNYTDRCSVHVHTNVQDFTPHQLATLCLVYSVVEEVLFEFVNHFKVDDPKGKWRDTNLYCVPWNQCRMNHNIVTNMFSDINYTFRNWQKYTALNLIPVRGLGTVEWRHMHGTADMDKLTLWLNLIGCVMKYAKERPFEDVVKTIKTLNDTSAYRQFFTDTLGEYLTYDNKFELALSQGVVNAKYSMIGLKDFKFKAPSKKASALDMEARVQMVMDDALDEGPRIRRDPLQDWLDARLRQGQAEAQLNPFDHPAPAARQFAPQGDPAAAANMFPVDAYPARKGTAMVQRARRDMIWSEPRQEYYDARTGRAIARGDVSGWRNHHLPGQPLVYCAGWGPLYQTNVTAQWRPGQPVPVV